MSTENGRERVITSPGGVFDAFADAVRALDPGMAATLAPGVD